MTKKYIKYYDGRIYARYYYEGDIIYYNLNFCAETQLIVYKGSAGSESFNYQELKQELLKKRKQRVIEITDRVYQIAQALTEERYTKIKKRNALTNKY